MCLKCASFPWVRGPLTRVLMGTGRNIETLSTPLGVGSKSVPLVPIPWVRGPLARVLTMIRYVACISFLSSLQKLTTEHTEHAERLRFVNNFWPLGACKKNFTTLCSMKDKIIFSLCDLRGLCGEKITFLQ